MSDSLRLGVDGVDIRQVQYVKNLDGSQYSSLRAAYTAVNMECPRTLVKTSKGQIYSPTRVDLALSTLSGSFYQTVDVGDDRHVPIRNVERIYPLNESMAKALADEVERLGPTFNTIVSMGPAGTLLSDRSVEDLRSACGWDSEYIA